MNQVAPYPPQDVHQQHMATTHAHPPTSGPGAPMGHYAQYQAPMVQQHPYSSSPAAYAANSYSYASYPAAPATSSMSNIAVVSHVGQPPQLNTMQQPPPSSALPNTQNFHGHTMDTSGQIAPPGMKPRVTATLWEDEGSLCFQVEAKGICVARREDNHMINGTKLLNVAGMTRGRRDGILKSEKVRHVVKIGPMHLKGVWIPFDRALEFANKEKITEQLYPLFVHDIGALLYHPSNPNQHARGGIGSASTLAAIDRTQNARRNMMGGAGPAPPAPIHGIGQVVNAPQVPSPSQARPGLDRAHTFPTPPASASSVVNMGAQGGPYDSWNNSVSSLPSAQPLSIDTGISNQRASVPNTPASTPPGKSTQGATHYPTPQSYDTSRSVYSNPAPQQPQYSSEVRFGGPLQSSSYQPHKKEDDDSHKHASEYHSSNPPYSTTSQSPYMYQPSPAQQAPGAEVPRVADISSPHQTNGSGRQTPRGSASQSWQGGYPTPQRSNTAPIYNVMEQPREAANGAPDGYYQSAPYSNGAVPSNKRGRDDDDDAEEVKRVKLDGHPQGGPVGGESEYAVNGARGSINRGKR